MTSEVSADLSTRTLSASERPYACGPVSLPIVIEAKGRQGASWLASRVASAKDAITAALHTHGALLFRGFDVTTDADFERIVTSVDGARPMAGYFMSEPGRDRIEGTRAVLNTSSIYKTGGALYLGGFHSENFYSTEVPSLQAFWCKEPSRLGGETALVQSADVYADLPRHLQEKLEKERVLARWFSLRSVAERYGMDEHAARARCLEVGLELEDDASGTSVLLFKPPVIKHPHTGRPALQINVSGEVPGFDAALRREAAPSYRGLRWALHRAAWRSPSIASLLPVLDSYPLLRSTLEANLARLKRRGAPPPSPPSPRGRLAERLTPADVQVLARAVWRHTSVFTWRRGDVLVCDQLQLLHAGMPGRGRREIHVMMCDPIRMAFPLSSGLYTPPPLDRAEASVGDKFANPHQHV